MADLEKDPGERNNCIDDPNMREVVIRMQKDVLKWLQATADVVPFHYDSRFNPQMMWEMVKHKVSEEKEDQVRKMIREGATLPAIMRFCDE